MKALCLGASLLLLGSAPADAQQRVGGGGLRLPVPPPPPLFEFNSGFPGYILVEREVPVIVEREVPAPAPPPQAVPLPIASQQGGSEGKRKPYVIGASYASLPPSCMKLIEEGGKATYYYCDGDWYRQVGDGRGASYRAVAKKL